MREMESVALIFSLESRRGMDDFMAKRNMKGMFGGNGMGWLRHLGHLPVGEWIGMGVIFGCGRIVKPLSTGVVS